MQRCSWFRVFLPAATAALLQASPCLAFPPLPSSFYGQVKVNGSNVPAGTVVRAVVNGRTYAESYTQIYQGDSTFGLDVPGDDPGSSAVEGGREGEAVSFEVGGLPALPMGAWRSGTNISLDLAASGAVSLVTVTPSPVPTHTSSPTPRPSPSPRPASPSPTRQSSSTPTHDGGLVPSPVGNAGTPLANTPAATPAPASQIQTAAPLAGTPSAPGSSAGPAILPATAEMSGAGQASNQPVAGSGSPSNTSVARSEPEPLARAVPGAGAPAPDKPGLAHAGQPQPAPLLAPAASQVSAVPIEGQEIDWLATWRSRCQAGLAVVAVAGCGMAVGLVWTLRRKK